MNDASTCAAIVFEFLFIMCRRSGEVRGARSGEARDRGLVARHGAGDGRLQDQAERHPGALQGRHQAHVRVVRLGRLALIGSLRPALSFYVSFVKSCTYLCLTSKYRSVYYCNTKFSLERVRTNDR